MSVEPMDSQVAALLAGAIELNREVEMLRRRWQEHIASEPSIGTRRQGRERRARWEKQRQRIGQERNRLEARFALERLKLKGVVLASGLPWPPPARGY